MVLYASPVCVQLYRKHTVMFIEPEMFPLSHTHYYKIVRMSQNNSLIIVLSHIGLLYNRIVFSSDYLSMELLFSFMKKYMTNNQPYYNNNFIFHAYI